MPGREADIVSNGRKVKKNRLSLATEPRPCEIRAGTPVADVYSMETSRKDPRQICVRILSTQFYLSCCDKEKEEVLLLSLARGAIQALHCMVRRP